MLNKPWMFFMLLCFILFLLAPCIPSDVSTVPSTSSQKKNRSNEVMALVAFKHNSIEADSNGFLDDWNPSSLSPCSWIGVSCSPSGKVSALNLTGAGLVGRLFIDHLMVLENLQHLYLSGNSFSGNLIQNKSSYPCVMETLDISFNNLSEPISETFFDSCNRLISLNLSHNLIPEVSFALGTSLLELDLSSNLISDPKLNHSFLGSQNLRLLNLSHNKLSAAPLVSELPETLEFLDISHNNLSGNFSALEFKNCAKLLVLNLSNNALCGTEIPQSLTNCQLLESLDFSHNKLQGKILAALGNLRNLKYLNLAHNDFSGDIPPELGRTCRTLVVLDLSGNKLSGEFPKTFKSCDYLQSLNLGNNQLSGNFLATVISTLPRLQILQVPFNKISGRIPPSLGNITRLQVLNLSSNAFTGNIPDGLCSSPTAFFPLRKLLLAGNFLSGPLPSDIRNCKNLRTIDFSLNNLSGPIPPDVWMLPHLSDLILWGNGFTGEIPKEICFNGSKLEMLILNNNLFTGPIPESVSHCKSLIWLSLSSNQLSGEIPAGIGKLQKLGILQLSHNSFTGWIPPELDSCQSLVWLELNHNFFIGSIPSELANQKGIAFKNDCKWNFAYVRSEGENGCNIVHGLLYLGGTRPESLVGHFDSHSCSSIRVYHGSSFSIKEENGSMIYLDLSFNFLSGSIPDSLCSMSYLNVLHLEHNRLTGTIPESLGSLKSLGVLDLSHNQLEGGIPEPLDFLSEMDVSNNNLSDTKPLTGRLQSFPASAFENNSGLCGYPLPSCDSKKPQADSVKHQADNSSTYNEFEWIWFASWIVNGLIIGAFAGIILFEVKYQWFVKKLHITPRRRSKQMKNSIQIRQPCRRRECSRICSIFIVTTSSNISPCSDDCI